MAADELSVPDPMAAAGTLAKAAGGGGGSAGGFFLGLVFSGIGFVALTYGKRTGNSTAMIVGGLLMVYPYFTPDVTSTLVVGVILCVVLWRSR